MFNYDVHYGSPWYLTLLALLPLLWYFSARSLAILGRVRCWTVIGLRSIVLALLVIALADVQTVRTDDRLTVIYLLDQSLSIPADRREAMVEYVDRAILEHREDQDRVGVIVFGGDAAIEIPPFDDDVQVLKVGTELDAEHTNLADAIKLAQASFPEDAAKRIVLVSDGNQNLGDALEQARAAQAAGIGIDVVPVRYHRRGEVAVERLGIPGNIRGGQPFDLKAVLSNTADTAAGGSGDVSGKLVFYRVLGDQRVVLNPRPEDQKIVLPPGKSYITWREKIEAAGFFTYEARFTPDDPAADATSRNNATTAFTHVRGKGRVLLIEDFNNVGQSLYLVGQLQKQDLEVIVQPSNQLFTSLDELQSFDTVVLANVPRGTTVSDASGDNNDVVHFTDAQIRMLVRNTQQMGAGLVMIGGQDSFGAGGWTNTELEKAMPVDFHIDNARVVAKGALVMMMHACEIPQGNTWQKRIAHEAIKTLGGQDYCGLIHWNGRTQWMWGGRQGLSPVQGNRTRMMAAVDRMTPGDMPDFQPAMQMALAGFQSVQDAKYKHMIIISDGDPEPPTAAVVNGFATEGVSITTVSIGDHSLEYRKRLKDLARAPGKFYAPSSAQALPRIFQREARRVARPLIWEKRPVRPTIESSHELVNGLEGPLLPLGGFVLTSVKSSDLVDVHLRASEAAGDRNSTILASWTYGLGKVVAFTSDSGQRWMTPWCEETAYDKLFGQMVRWSMRPTSGSGHYSVATEVVDGRVRVVVTALDDNDEFLNLVTMTGSAVDPDLKPVSIDIEQTGPGRYVGSFPAGDPGSYFLNIGAVTPDGKPNTIRTGVTVPYSNEFRDRREDDHLLRELAALAPKGYEPGEFIDEPSGTLAVEPLLATNIFRHNLPKALSSQDIWFYLLLLAGCLFFFDVFFRRVQVSFAWVGPALAVLRRRETVPAEAATIERLRSRKAQVDERIEQLRSDARFETPADAPAAPDVLDEPPRPAPPSKKPTMTSEEKEQESYTERLLKAKKKLWKDE